MITFQQVDIYLNEPIKTDKLIKLANQSTQRHTCDRNGKDNSNSYFRKQKKVSHSRHRKKWSERCYVLIFLEKRHIKGEKGIVPNGLCRLS